MAKCVECGRRFDLSDEEQAEEYYYGHDCEEHNEKLEMVRFSRYMNQYGGL